MIIFLLSICLSFYPFIQQPFTQHLPCVKHYAGYRGKWVQKNDTLSALGNLKQYISG